MRRAPLIFATSLAAWASFAVPFESARGDSMASPPRATAVVASPALAKQPASPFHGSNADTLTAAFKRSDLAKTAPKWVLEKPPRSTQTQKSVSARGINPCLTPDPGFGTYSSWDRAPSMGQMIVPERLQLNSAGQFDVVFHFHGHEPARKEWVNSAVEGPVLVGIDLGLGSGPYLSKFGQPAVFRNLVNSVERAIAKRSGNHRARVGRVAVSAWSAGYGAVEQILRSSYGRQLVDTVILLDGLHTGYEDHNLRSPTLSPFVQFAREAARAKKLMFVSHSSIIPPGYASTTETANFLIWKVGGKPEAARPRPGDPMGLELISRFTHGGFHVRGYAGNDTHDHCAHLGLYRDVIRTHLAPRWRLATRG